MKKIDSNGLKLCEIQANFFENSRDSFMGSSAVFIRRFMNSRLAQRMDSVEFLFGSDNPKNFFTELDEEFGKTSYGSEKYSSDELYWIGYIYRYWAYTYEISTNEVYKIIKPTELRLLFFPYHSLDPKIAIERILEAKEMREEDKIANGVRILREIRKTKEEKTCL